MQAKGKSSRGPARGKAPAPPQKKVQAILELLVKLYPEAGCTLDHQDPLQLLVATILSAQCTDERVNQLTPHLFSKYPSARTFAEAPLEELEQDIKPTGFFRNKAKSIQASCRIIADHYDGRVPADLDALVELPGIGRKTANVILGTGFHIPSGIVVDTHVGRVAGRLGLTRNKDAVKIEQDLMDLIPREQWIRFSHQVILHGRNVCQARKPKCPGCSLRPYCDFGTDSPA